MKMGLPSPNPRGWGHPQGLGDSKGRSWSEEKIIGGKIKLPVSPSPCTSFVLLLIYIAAFHSRGKSLI